MNGSTAKASRRELRRAFGPDAVETIQQHDADIRALTLNHNAAQKARVTLSEVVNARIDDHAAKLLAWNEFKSADFKARFRWLFLGR